MSFSIDKTLSNKTSLALQWMLHGRYFTKGYPVHADLPNRLHSPQKCATLTYLVHDFFPQVNGGICRTLGPSFSKADYLRTPGGEWYDLVSYWSTGNIMEVTVPAHIAMAQWHTRVTLQLFSAWLTYFFSLLNVRTYLLRRFIRITVTNLLIHSWWFTLYYVIYI